MRTIALSILLFCSAFLNAQKLEKVWSTPKNLQTPESVLFNAELNIVFVANMGTTLGSKTGDGFIAKMNLKGEMTNLKWVTGLNDPKGMAIWNGELYVSDMDELVVIDIKDAKIVAHYPAPDSKFLNDVAVSDNGIVFVSDMKDQRIYALQNRVFSSWLFADKLNLVNGLWCENGKLYAGNTSVWEINIASKEMKELFNQTGEIDGLESIGNGNFIFSNWAGRIYVSDNGKVIKLLDSSEEKLNTADIDYVSEEKLVLVPSFFGNNVDAYKLVW
jgi:hypothetical protein